MPAYPKSFTDEIERRIANGTLKVASSFGNKNEASNPVKSAGDGSAKSSNKPGKTGGGNTRKMNKLESEYAQRLEALKACGEIIWWSFESVKLRLADNTFYTPDFFVQRVDGSFEVHETKGFMRDDANVKLKVANEFFPWTFYLVRKEVGGFGWDIRKIGNKDF